MDARIGILQRATEIVYYAFVNGYDQQQFESEKLSDVEKALGLEPTAEEPQFDAEQAAYDRVEPIIPRVYFKQIFRDGEVLTGYVEASNLTEARRDIARSYQQDVPRHMRVSYRIEWTDEHGNPKRI